MVIQAGTPSRELVQSPDNGASWALINPPPGVGAMRTLRNVGSRLFAVGQGTPQINTSDDGGLNWDQSDSGLSGAVQVAFVAPDELRCIHCGGGNNFAVSQSLAASPPVWTNFTTLALFGIPIVIQTADWSDDSLVCAASGSNSDIMFSEDGGLTWSMIPRAINPLINAGSGNSTGVVFSPGNEGFYFVNNDDLICFLSLDDMTTPIKVDAPASLTFNPAEQMANGLGQVILFDDGSSTGRSYAIPAVLEA